MKKINTGKLFKGGDAGNIIIIAASVLLLYLLVSIYFSNRFFFNTVINGAKVSLKPYDNAEPIIKSYIKDYKLQLVERNGETEEITGQDIGMQYNEKNSIYKIYGRKNSIGWIGSLFKAQKYYVDDLYIYNKDSLENKINQLNCLNKAVIEPKNISFKYVNGSYEVVEEVYGNKIIRDKLDEAIKSSILQGKTKLDLNEEGCYENPKYTLCSHKIPETRALLNKYVSTKITYKFGNKYEILDRSTINKWLGVDENLDVTISQIAVVKYVRGLGEKYDTAGAARRFKTSTGKAIEVKGGFYGWKIDFEKETKALMENIKLGKALEKEPVYEQRALSRDGNEIGNTYVEINITRQLLWFYKDGRLIAQGSVVTGNPSNGNATELGTFMLNYKQKGATLTGEDYEAEVTYWMPFFGNMGIHDATWRSSFGGDIYKTDGTHGCVNAPLYLAKAIFENIDEGTPIICYEE